MAVISSQVRRFRPSDTPLLSTIRIGRPEREVRAYIQTSGTAVGTATTQNSGHHRQLCRPSAADTTAATSFATKNPLSTAFSAVTLRRGGIRTSPARPNSAAQSAGPSPVPTPHRLQAPSKSRPPDLPADGKGAKPSTHQSSGAAAAAAKPHSSPPQPTAATTATAGRATG